MATVHGYAVTCNPTVDDQVKARILRQRPYHPWHLMDLAAFLCVEGYSDAARDQIVDAVDEGYLLDSLVALRILEPHDLPGAAAALEAGRKRRAERALTTLSVEPFMPGPDEPDPFDEVLELDAALDAEDTSRLDRRLAEMRQWYDEHGSWGDWVDRQGGISREVRS